MIVPLWMGAGCTADFGVLSTIPTDTTVDVVVYVAAPSVGYVLTVAASGAKYTSTQAAIYAAAVATQSQPYVVNVAPGSYIEPIMLNNHEDLQVEGTNLAQMKWSAGTRRR